MHMDDLTKSKGRKGKAATTDKPDLERGEREMTEEKAGLDTQVTFFDSLSEGAKQPLDETEAGQPDTLEKRQKDSRIPPGVEALHAVDPTPEAETSTSGSRLQSEHLEGDEIAAIRWPVAVPSAAKVGAGTQIFSEGAEAITFSEAALKPALEAEVPSRVDQVDG